MRILYIAGNPEGASTLQTERELNLMQAQIDEANSTDPVDIRVYSSLRVDELPSVIARVQPDVVHFSAHGAEDAIILAHADRGHVSLRGTDLADLLEALAVRPKLVVINACSSDRMAAEVSRAADFVIGTDAPISNVGARTMAATLYQRLAMSSSILSAFKAAETMLRIVDLGAVKTHLFPVAGTLEAQRTRLAEPLRILACFPKIEKWLDDGLARPRTTFDIMKPVVHFGVAGAPSNAVQLVFFTDDETVEAKKNQSLADARSYIVQTRAVRGEMWLDDEHDDFYYGDMQWYASAVTSDGKIQSASSRICDALDRYYFEEEWRDGLSRPYVKLIRAAIQQLRYNDGARRAPKPRPSGPAPKNDETA